MASRAERALAAEWVVVVGLQTLDAMAQSGSAGAKAGKWPSGKPSWLPQPSRYFAAMFAYLILAGIALFGEAAARVAMALGGIVALAIVIAPPNPSQPVGAGNEPLVVRFFGFVSSLEQGGFISQPGQQAQGATPSAGSSSTPLPLGLGAVQLGEAGLNWVEQHI